MRLASLRTRAAEPRGPERERKVRDGLKKAARTNAGSDAGRIDMIAFEAFVNGRKLCRAGVGDDGVTLCACLAWIADVEAHAGNRGPRGRRGTPFLLLEGRAADSYKAWPQVELAIGDQIRLKIVETDHVDPPADERLDSDSDREEWERRLYRRLRRKYGRPRRNRAAS